MIELQRLKETGIDFVEGGTLWETLNKYPDSEAGMQEAAAGLSLANLLQTEPRRLRTVRLVGDDEFLIDTNHLE